MPQRGASDERELRGVEIDVMALVEAHGEAVEEVKGDDEAYVDALSFENFRATWIQRRFSNVHLGKPAQSTYNGFVQCAYDCALKYVRNAKTLGTRVAGAYCVYALHQTQLEGESVCVYVCPEAMETVAELIDECAAIGVRDVGRVMLKLLNENAFVCGVRDVTANPASRMGAGAPEVYKNFDEKTAIHEALGHLLQGDLSKELRSMEESASEYTSSLAVATKLDDTGAGAPVMICSTVDTLLTKTRTKVEKALRAPIDEAAALKLLPSSK